MGTNKCNVTNCESPVRVKLRGLCEAHYQRFLDNRARALGQPTRTQRTRLKDLDAYRKRKREYAKSPAERKKRRAYQRKWTSENREHCNKWRREYARKHALHLKEIRFLKDYGITLAMHEAMIEEQNRKCKICSRTFNTELRPYVDHCHITGRVRGIVCNGCNRCLGWYERYAKNIAMHLEG